MALRQLGSRDYAAGGAPEHGKGPSWILPTSSKEGLDIIREVDSPCVKLLFDVYHQLHMGEDIVPVLEGNPSLISHFHVAGLPNRDEKIFAVFNFCRFFDFMKENKAEQPIGIELFPTGSEAHQHLMAVLQTILQR